MIPKNNINYNKTQLLLLCGFLLTGILEGATESAIDKIDTATTPWGKLEGIGSSFNGLFTFSDNLTKNEQDKQKLKIKYDGINPISAFLVTSSFNKSLHDMTFPSSLNRDKIDECFKKLFGDPGKHCDSSKIQDLFIKDGYHEIPPAKRKDIAGFFVEMMRNYHGASDESLTRLKQHGITRIHELLGIVNRDKNLDKALIPRYKTYTQADGTKLRYIVNDVSEDIYQKANRTRKSSMTPSITSIPTPMSGPLPPMNEDYRKYFMTEQGRLKLGTVIDVTNGFVDPESSSVALPVIFNLDILRRGSTLKKLVLIKDMLNDQILERLIPEKKDTDILEMNFVQHKIKHHAIN